MRALAVVVVDVNAEHAFELTAVEDQQPVETFGTHAPDEALRARVCFRRSHRRLHDPGAPATEDFVEGAAVLASLSRSRIRNRTSRSEKSRPSLRACWV